MVFVLCTKFGSNIGYSHWDRRTYPSDLHVMTSRELTSGFEFWPRGHLRMAVMHLPIKFGADIFIQSGVIDIFPKFNMAAAAILDFQVMWIWQTPHDGIGRACIARQSLSLHLTYEHMHIILTFEFLILWTLKVNWCYCVKIMCHLFAIFDDLFFTQGSVGNITRVLLQWKKFGHCQSYASE